MPPHLPCRPSSQHCSEAGLLPTPWERHLRVPVEPTEQRALSGTEWFPDGEGNVYLFSLESVQAEQCRRLGRAQKASGRDRRGQCAELWPPDPRMCYDWLRPLLVGKCGFWIGLCFSIRAGSEGEGHVTPDGGPEAGERLQSSWCPSHGTGPAGSSPGLGAPGGGAAAPSPGPSLGVPSQARWGGWQEHVGTNNTVVVGEKSSAPAPGFVHQKGRVKSPHSPTPRRQTPPSPCSRSIIAVLLVHHSHTNHLGKVYSSMTFSKLTELCNHRHN